MNLCDEIKKEAGGTHSINEIKNSLIRRGYLEADIDEAIKKQLNVKTEEKNKNNKILSIKELFDRIGYGFASQQFVNILFMLSGASLLLIGIINGLKTVFTYLLSGFLKEYSKIVYIGKRMISTAGIIFGFSFLGMAFAVVIKSPTLFAFSALIGSLGIIAHGEVYAEFYNNILKNEKRKNFLRFISYFGIIITAGSLLLSGFLIELFPINGVPISFDIAAFHLAEPIGFKIYGYLLAFEITAIMFILSGYLLSFVDETKNNLYNEDASIFYSFKEYVKTGAQNTSIFTKNHKIMLLAIATVLTTIAQILGNSYYGIFIYNNFKSQFFKGFLNVAIIFVIALIASIIGTMITKKVSKGLGEAPMLVFGTLLIALLPITFYFNPNLYSIGFATALSVIGGAIVGVAQGLIAERLMTEEELKIYFSSLGFISIVPTLILVIIGAIVAQFVSLSMLFLIIGIILVALVMPVYFIIVLIADKEYRKEKSYKSQ